MNFITLHLLWFSRVLLLYYLSEGKNTLWIGCQPITGNHADTLTYPHTLSDLGRFRYLDNNPGSGAVRQPCHPLYLCAALENLTNSHLYVYCECLFSTRWHWSDRFATNHAVLWVKYGICNYYTVWLFIWSSHILCGLQIYKYRGLLWWNWSTGCSVNFVHWVY